MINIFYRKVSCIRCYGVLISDELQNTEKSWKKSPDKKEKTKWGLVPFLKKKIILKSGTKLEKTK